MELLFKYLVDIIFVFVLIEFFTIFFDLKVIDKKIRIAVWSVYVVGLAFLNHIFSQSNDSILTIIFLFVILSYLYEGSWKSKIFVMILETFLFAICTALMKYGLLISFQDIDNHMLIGSIISKILFLSLIRIIKLCANSQLEKKLSNKYLLIMLVIPLSSILLINNLYNTAVKVAHTIDAYSILSIALIFVIDIFIFYIFNNLIEESEMAKQNAVYENQLVLLDNQNREREELYKNWNNHTHDFKNHLICLNEFKNKKDYAALGKYLDDLSTKIIPAGVTENMLSGNLAIDAIINNKSLIAKSSDLNIEIDLEIPPDLEFDNSDLCIILGNSLDNAIEACEKVERKYRFIYVFLRLIHGNLFILIKNSYNGQLKKTGKGLRSTKNDSLYHGIGLSSIKKAITKYNGSMDIDSSDKSFEISILLYSRNRNE